MEKKIRNIIKKLQKTNEPYVWVQEIGYWICTQTLQPHPSHGVRIEWVD